MQASAAETIKNESDSDMQLYHNLMSRSDAGNFGLNYYEFVPNRINCNHILISKLSVSTSLKLRIGP